MSVCYGGPQIFGKYMKYDFHGRLLLICCHYVNKHLWQNYHGFGLRLGYATEQLNFSSKEARQLTSELPKLDRRM